MKSVQRGTITLTGATSNTATITSVVPANCLLTWLGESGTNTSNNPGIGWAGLTFTNATTITATRTTGTNNLTVSFEVLEFWPGVLKSVQRGQTSALTVTPTTVTLGTAVNTAKTLVSCLGHQHGSFGYQVDYSECSYVLTDSTTLTFTLTNAAATAGVIMHYQVAEFY